jgi:UDP-glucose 4-epimerase
MRVVITGASGNVGTALIRRLLAAGGYDVVGLARRVPDYGSLDGPQWVSVDLSSRECGFALQRVIRGADAVVHLAWGFQPSHQVPYLEAVGVGGTGRVLDAIASLGIGHVVHMSSVGAYAPKRDAGPVDEQWPVEALPSSSYSRHKVAAERLLDSFERSTNGTVVTRLRPGIIGQRCAGSALLRYALPALLPAKTIDVVPVLPMPAGLTVPIVHADDVADAIVRVLQQRVAGAFNLASAMPVSAPMIAEALGARWVATPARLVHAVMAATWRARLQPVSPEWLDLACAVPALDSARAERELGWVPVADAETVLHETIAGMRHAATGTTAVLRQRTVQGELSELFRRGPVSHRPQP